MWHCEKRGGVFSIPSRKYPSTKGCPSYALKRQPPYTGRNNRTHTKNLNSRSHFQKELGTQMQSNTHVQTIQPCRTGATLSYLVPRSHTNTHTHTHTHAPIDLCAGTCRQRSGCRKQTGRVSGTDCNYPGTPVPALTHTHSLSLLMYVCVCGDCTARLTVRTSARWCTRANTDKRAKQTFAVQTETEPKPVGCRIS